MSLHFLKNVGSLFFLSVFSLHIQAAEDNCMHIFTNMQHRFSVSDVSFTATVGDLRSIIPFSYRHDYANGHEYTVWRTLNGESEGYALRDLDGFDFNDDRSLKKPLSWHNTQVFDRLVSEKNELKGYQCIFSGRTRLNGRKVSLLRLLPRNDLRYGLSMAIDDESGFPVELEVVTPQGAGVTKISATDIKKNVKAGNMPSDNEFERFSLLKTANTEPQDAWGFVNIPPYFNLVSQGAVQMPDGGDVCPYQQFSDGIFSFRVYINSISSVTLPEVRVGSLSVYRMHDANREYAVVGEIPMEMAKSVLSNVGRN